VLELAVIAACLKADPHALFADLLRRRAGAGRR
jgi:hypothetical protein